MPQVLEQLLQRSAELHTAINNALSTAQIPNHAKVVVAATHADIAL